MAWIKRNLIFVITSAVGLVLAGFCGYLLFTALQKNSGVLEDYNQTISSLNQLRQTKPYPDDASIKEAKQDQMRVSNFLGDFKKTFAPFPTPPTLDARGFKDYLQQTIFQWGLDATNANVALPNAYLFSWSIQMDRLNYAPEGIPPWLQQLQEEKSILHILFDAHINYLEYIKRVPTAYDEANSGDYIPTTSTTGPGGSVVTPYAIAFRGFSSDLAAVLAGFARSTNCLIVMEVEVTPSKAALPMVITPVAPAAAAAPAQVYRPPPVMDPYRTHGGPGSFDRGGGRPQYIPPPQVVQAAPAAPTGPVTILTENPLYITMAIDVVKTK